MLEIPKNLIWGMTIMEANTSPMTLSLSTTSPPDHWRAAGRMQQAHRRGGGVLINLAFTQTTLVKLNQIPLFIKVNH